MKRSLFFILAVAITSCHQKQSSPPNSQLPLSDQVLPVKMPAAHHTDSIGAQIADIEFKVKATKEELDIADDGLIPWISLEHPDKEMSRLTDADEVVLPYSTVDLYIDYPLGNPVTFKLSSGKGFTRKQLILEISRRYHQIYQEEEQSASVKTVPEEKREGVINRNETNGKYGVCCHDLSDLDLGDIMVYKNTDGAITLVLNVES